MAKARGEGKDGEIGFDKGEKEERGRKDKDKEKEKKTAASEDDVFRFQARDRTLLLNIVFFIITAYGLIKFIQRIRSDLRRT